MTANSFRRRIILVMSFLILIFNALCLFYIWINESESFSLHVEKFILYAGSLMIIYNLSTAIGLFLWMSKSIVKWLQNDNTGHNIDRDLMEKAWANTINFPLHYSIRLGLFGYLPSAALFLVAVLIYHKLAVSTLINITIGVFLLSAANLIIFGILNLQWLMAPLRETFRSNAKFTQSFFHKRLTTYMSLSFKMILTLVTVIVANMVALGGFAYFSVAKQVSDEKVLTTVLLHISFFTMFAIVLSVGLAYLNANVIARSVDEVRLKLKEIAEEGGDLRDRVVITAGDEIGKLVYWFNHFLNKLQLLISMTLETTSQISGASRDLSEVNHGVAASMQELTATVFQISKGAEAQSMDIARMVNRANVFAELAGEVSAEAHNTETYTREILKTTSEGHKSAKESQHRMESLAQATTESVNAVKSLIRKSNEIQKIVNTVQDISRQTNLLALNAAIEAARAGEHGRGFSVVADEVRKLAGDTDTALKQIFLRVTEIQEATDSVISWISQVEEEVSHGQSVFTATGKLLDDINTKVQENSRRVKKIASSSHDQQMEIVDLVSSLTSVASIAEENAASSDTAASAIEEQVASINQIAVHQQNLQQMVENLADQLNQFKV